MKATKDKYRKALDEAVAMMEETEVEPTSALKQAASDNGIPYGKEMTCFVTWANKQLGI